MKIHSELFKIVCCQSHRHHRSHLPPFAEVNYKSENYSELLNFSCLLSSPSVLIDRTSMASCLPLPANSSTCTVITLQEHNMLVLHKHLFLPWRKASSFETFSFFFFTWVFLISEAEKPTSSPFPSLSTFQLVSRARRHGFSDSTFFFFFLIEDFQR